MVEIADRETQETRREYFEHFESRDNHECPDGMVEAFMETNEGLDTFETRLEMVKVLVEE